MRYVRFRKGLSAVLLSVTLCCSGCLSIPMPKEHLPEETIEEFEDAVNAMDVDGMMDCLDESAAKTVEASLSLTMGLVGAVTGIELDISAEDLIALMPVFQGIAIQGGAYDEIEIPQVDFQVTQTYIKGDKATVFFTEAASGEAQAINMEKSGGRWYMTFNLVPIREEEADKVLRPGEKDTSVDDGENSAADTEKHMEEGLTKLLNLIGLPDFLNQDELKEDIMKLLKKYMNGSPQYSVDDEKKIHLDGFAGAENVVLEEYKIGDYYPNKNKITIDGENVDLGAAQCFGFARYVQYKLYGESDYNGNFSVLEGSSAVSADRLKEGDTLKNLITAAGPGAHIRTMGKQHSMVVAEVREDGFTIIHANGDGKGTVLENSYTWAEYNSKWGTRGISYIKVHNQD